MNGWRICLFVLVVFMIDKDLMFAPFPYFQRIFSQCLCLLLGIGWLMNGFSVDVAKRYWPVIFYLVVLYVSAPFTKYPLFVLLQVTSLLTVILFFISYHETQNTAGSSNQVALIRLIIVCYAIVVAGSLILAKLQPGLAYRSFFAGTSVGQEVRFIGLFGNAGGMGQAAGLLLGLSAVSIRRLAPKFALVSIALVGLFLTESRSFWIGAIFAGVTTIWIYYPKWRLRASVTALLVLLTGSVVFLVGHGINDQWLLRVTRSYSWHGLNGREYLWEQAKKGIGSSPLIGFGLSMGATGMEENRLSNVWTSDDVSNPALLSRVTFHNGYVQSLMDSGVIGTCFYLATMVVGIWRLGRNDIHREHPTAFYSLIFLCVSNMGESVIYSAAMFPSLFFWACAIFAMSLRPSTEQVPIVAVADRVNDGTTALAYPNLLR